MTVEFFIKNVLSKIEKYKVNLVVADSIRDEKNSINIYDVDKSKDRINRIYKTTNKVLQ